MATKPTLNQKLLAIMSELPFIQKDKKNPGQGYTYASEEAIKKAIHPLLVEHGVLVRLDVVDASTEPTPKGTQILTTARFAYTFTNVDDGEKIEGVFMGSGADPGDKGLNKAITAALKYLLTSTFLIPTGDDPEASRDEEQPMERIVAKPSAVEAGLADQLQQSIDQVAQAKGMGQPKPTRRISDKQRNRMYAIAMNNGFANIAPVPGEPPNLKDYKTFLRTEFGITDDRNTPAGKGPGQYDQIVARLEQGPPETESPPEVPEFRGADNDDIPF